MASVGYVALVGTFLFFITRFPLAKQTQGISLSRFGSLLSDGFLLLIGLFLFCQSSFEAIINNWATTYLLDKIPITMTTIALAAYLANNGRALQKVVRMPSLLLSVLELVQEF